MADFRVLSYLATKGGLTAVIGRSEDRVFTLTASFTQADDPSLIHVRRDDNGPLLIHRGGSLIYAIKHAVQLLNSGKGNFL